MSYDAVIYDLDGTLLNTLRDLAEAFNGALEERGFAAHPVDAYRYFVGDGARMAVVRALPERVREDEGVIEGVLEAFRVRYDRGWNVYTHPYEGIVAVVQTLHARGKKQAILTNKPHSFAVKVAHELLPGECFVSVQGLEEGIRKKPDPQSALMLAEKMAVAPSRCAFVGDTRTDMATATAAGMYPIGVLWGFRDERELRESGAATIVRTPEELGRLFSV